MSSTREARSVPETALTKAKILPLRPWRGDGDVRRYLENAKSENTRKGYARDFARFETWCAEEGFPALPATPPTVARYAATLARQGKKINSIRRPLAAIAHFHKERGFDVPTAHEAVKRTIAGIARTHGSAVTQASPILPADLKALVSTFDLETQRGCRDAAVLLLGFTMALRRSELVALNVEDLELHERGVVATIRRQKNDKEGKGMRKAVVLADDPTLCATLAVKRWLRISKRSEGSLFCTIVHGDHLRDTRLSGQGVNRIVKRAAEAAGLAEMGFTSHSMRAGFVTSAAKAGKSLDAIQSQTGHQSLSTLLGYIRRAVELGDDNPTTGLL
ncbi:MAG: site-specific integrase [Myxococcota bacterium]